MSKCNHKCEHCCPEKTLSVEDQSQNGVKVIVTRYKNGMTNVDADCSCLGYEGRAHNTHSCPNLKRLLELHGVKL